MCHPVQPYIRCLSDTEISVLLHESLDNLHFENLWFRKAPRERKLTHPNCRDQTRQQKQSATFQHDSQIKKSFYRGSQIQNSFGWGNQTKKSSINQIRGTVPKPSSYSKSLGWRALLSTQKSLPLLHTLERKAWVRQLCPRRQSMCMPHESACMRKSSKRWKPAEIVGVWCVNVFWGGTPERRTNSHPGNRQTKFAADGESRGMGSYQRRQ